MFVSQLATYLLVLSVISTIVYLISKNSCSELVFVRYQLILKFVCLCSLAYLFLVDDFSVTYVAVNSNSLLPWYYKLSAIWGGHEGSMLLWLFIYSCWILALARAQKQPAVLMAIRLLLLLDICFCLFVLVLANPFAMASHAVLDGRDLNPLLQDWRMILHPPILYMGYLGLAVPFALTVANLYQRTLDKNYALQALRYMRISWSLLTVGIVLGSIWAYHELGWGGWWFWDPVENASFMPWLVATASLHSLAVASKTGRCKHLAALCCILAFGLALFGLFLVRSSVISSVHAFANSPGRGLWLFLIFAVTLLPALLLWFVDYYRSQEADSFLSRYNFPIVANNIGLLLATICILFGTIYPLLCEFLYGEKISVGFPYFNMVFIPIMLLMLTALIYRFRGTYYRLLFDFSIAAILSIALQYICFATLNWAASIGLLYGVLIIIQCINHLFACRMQQLPMLLGHIGLAVFIIGVSVTPNYEQELELAIAPGQTIKFSDYNIKFQQLSVTDGVNYISHFAEFLVAKPKNKVFTLHPEKRLYLADELTITETAVKADIFSDLYIALGQRLDNGEYAVRLYHKPLIRLIWLGALIMAGSVIMRRGNKWS